VSYDTLFFALFLAVVWTAFRLLPGPGWILLVASVVFYTAAGPHDTALAAIVILANYGFQFAILFRRWLLYPSLALNFGCLAYFKYRVFLATATGFDVFTDKIIIPLGISFYIFQLSAFLIDLSRCHAQPFYSLPRFALFKLFFGQLIAGPIMRWREFGPQVNRLFEGRVRQHRLLGIGLGLCLLGLIKKVVLADSFAPFVDRVFLQGPASASVAWLAVWLATFQIYFDFSGYSDIALGIAYLFGLRLAVNFRQPFFAQSPTEFWRRWHITLSSWIRDYLFVPLARRMRSRAGAAVALLISLSLAGLWHGANWTFVVWGVA
jgi:alginate O-acetyltransferase complex protein AlgI